MWPPGLCTLPALGAASAVVESTGRTGHGGLLIWFVHFHWVKQVEQYTHTYIYLYIIYRVYVCVYIYIFFIDTRSHVYIYICTWYFCWHTHTHTHNSVSAVFTDGHQKEGTYFRLWYIYICIHIYICDKYIPTNGDYSASHKWCYCRALENLCFYIILFHLVGHALLIPTPLILRVTSQ